MNIYISYDREQRLRDYCAEKNLTISSVIASFIDSLVGTPYGVKLASEHFKDAVDKTIDQQYTCELGFCKSLSVGNFKVTTMELEGEVVKERRLCKLHVAMAKKEGSAEMI